MPTLALILLTGLLLLVGAGILKVVVAWLIFSSLLLPHFL